MGEAISRDLVSRGWTVAMTDIKENKALAEELGSKARFYNSNVANYASQAKMFQQVFKDFGQIDALCANAGIVDRQSLYLLGEGSGDEIPPEPDLLCTDVDWKGAYDFEDAFSICFTDVGSQEWYMGLTWLCTS